MESEYEADTSTVEEDSFSQTISEDERSTSPTEISDEETYERGRPRTRSLERLIRHERWQGVKEEERDRARKRTELEVFSVAMQVLAELRDEAEGRGHVHTDAQIIDAGEIVRESAYNHCQELYEDLDDWDELDSDQVAEVARVIGSDVFWAVEESS